MLMMKGSETGLW